MKIPEEIKNNFSTFPLIFKLLNVMNKLHLTSN